MDGHVTLILLTFSNLDINHKSPRDCTDNARWLQKQNAHTQISLDSNFKHALLYLYEN